MGVHRTLLYKDVQLYLDLSVLFIHVGAVHRAKAVLEKPGKM